MKELYQLEVEKGNTRVLKEYLSCNVIWNSATGVLRGFANRKNRTSLEAEIYISGFFDRKMNRLTILEVTKLRFRKPTLYVFKDIYKEGEYRTYSSEYRFMYPKPTGKASVKMIRLEESEEMEKEIFEFLSKVDERRELDEKKIGGIDLNQLESELKYYNFFLLSSYKKRLEFWVVFYYIGDFIRNFGATRLSSLRPYIFAKRNTYVEKPLFLYRK